MDDESECYDSEYCLNGVDYAEAQAEYVNQLVVLILRIPIRVVIHTQGDCVKKDYHEDEVFEKSIEIKRILEITLILLL